jgi:hypothetical protein
MKNLITLIFSTALLCPMWAGAQTTTTPSIQGQLHYSGSLTVYGAFTYFLNPAYFVLPCATITDIRLNIQSPNNSSPAKAISGYYNCLGGSWSTFSGVLVASNGSLPSTNNAVTTGYRGAFTLGLVQMNCTFPADLTSAFCQLVANTNNSTTSAGSGTFYYTSEP